MRNLIAVLGMAALVNGVRADDWPQWMGPQRDGVWREDGIVEKFPDGGPKRLWKYDCGSGYAGPAVAGGKVFVHDRVAEDGKYGKEGIERVLCIDEKTGKLQWKAEYPRDYRVSYPAGPRCTPTVDGDLV